ncbi:EAL domain-containing protein [Paenibacillus sp. LMG 31458]|uniref:EAL domain-containing protein n=1 Tax=Paenibacillus phytorum TaxID=2654977 RepID=A0ABX1Y3E2_9BACL|nr:EAL domain-containing protein [Paenibacillus phytorum]NOU74994.1 EAL domain-containing protein [Paenibacillus phytorum]
MWKPFIALAHSLGLEVVAEGMETEQQYAFLDALGCDHIQGYYFNRPMLAKEAASKLKELHNGKPHGVRPDRLRVERLFSIGAACRRIMTGEIFKTLIQNMNGSYKLKI